MAAVDDAGGNLQTYVRIRPRLVPVPRPQTAPVSQIPALGTSLRANVPSTPGSARKKLAYTSTTPAGTTKGIFTQLSVANSPSGSGDMPTRIVFENGQNSDETSTAGRQFTFEMDGVFTAQTSQSAVWAHVGKESINNVLQGYNSTILAYGRTNTGKTHTIIGPTGARSAGNWTFAELEGEKAGGPESQLGIVPRAVFALLHRMQATKNDHHFTLQFAAAEIYNRSLFDLCPGSGNLRVEVKDSRMTSSAAERLTWHDVDVRPGHEEAAMIQAQEVIQRANTARSSASTSANIDSSRSHVLYLFRLSSIDIVGTCTTASLSIVDLAGSETLDVVDKSSTASSRDYETKTINTSLHTLTKVVQAYAMAPPGEKPAHVPYRESLLTLLLRDAIGGNCRTTFVVTLAAEEDQLVHSYKTCQFAQLARGVRNCARENKSFDPSNLVASLKAQIQELQGTIESQSRELSRRHDAVAPVAQPFSLTTLVASCQPPNYGTDEISYTIKDWAATSVQSVDQFMVRIRQLVALIQATVACVQESGMTADLDTFLADLVRQSRKDALVSTSTSMSPAFLARSRSSMGSPQRVTKAQLSRAFENWCGGVNGQVLPRLQFAADLTDHLIVKAAAGGIVLIQRTIECLRQERALFGKRVGLLKAESDVASKRLRLAEGQVEDASTEPTLHQDANRRAAAAGSIILPVASLVDWQFWRPCECVMHDRKANSCKLCPGRWVSFASEISGAINAALTASERSVVTVGVDAAGAAAVRPAHLTQNRANVLDLASPGLAKQAERMARSVGVARQLARSTTVTFAADDATHDMLRYSLGMDNLAYFVVSTIDPAAGVQVCATTGATRSVRRLIHTVMEGDLQKRQRLGGGYTWRTLRLTPDGLCQLYPQPQRRQQLLAAKLGVDTLAPEAANAAAAGAGIKSWKVRFGDCSDAVAEIVAGNEQEGREFVVAFTVKGGKTRRRYFIAASAHDACTWVWTFNDAAQGRFRVADGDGSVPTAGHMAMPMVNREQLFTQHLAASERCSSSVEEVVSELQLPAWSSQAGCSPLGVSSLVGLDVGSPEWSKLRDRMLPELSVCDGYRVLARVLGHPNFSLHIAYAVRIQNLVIAANALSRIRAMRTIFARDSEAIPVIGTAYIVPESASEASAIVSYGLLPADTVESTSKRSLYLPTGEESAPLSASPGEAIDTFARRIAHARTKIGGASVGVGISRTCLIELRVVYRSKLSESSMTDVISRTGSTAITCAYPVYATWIDMTGSGNITRGNAEWGLSGTTIVNPAKAMVDATGTSVLVAVDADGSIARRI